MKTVEELIEAHPQPELRSLRDAINSGFDVLLDAGEMRPQEFNFSHALIALLVEHGYGWILDATEEEITDVHGQITIGIGTLIGAISYLEKNR